MVPASVELLRFGRGEVSESFSFLGGGYYYLPSRFYHPAGFDYRFLVVFYMLEYIEEQDAVEGVIGEGEMFSASQDCGETPPP